MSKKVYSSPGKFIIGKDELANLASYIKPYGNKAILVAHHDDEYRVAEQLKQVTDPLVLISVNFMGECTHQEIDRITTIAIAEQVNVVIGLGGGKAIDTAKAVAHLSHVPIIVIPTVASTDAPCSSLAVIYNDQHTVVDCLFLPKNPDLVLVDSQVIANAPSRYLVSGMGDGYATYFEARVCKNNNIDNYVGGRYTEAAFALSELCYHILLRDGVAALAACNDNCVTPALENVIEANLLLSGLGFENVGLAAAHGIHDAITHLPETGQALHGEKVAIGVLAQHILENETQEQIVTTLRFFKQIGLPTKLAEIGIIQNVNNSLRVIAQKAVENRNGLIHHMPFTVDEDLVYHALQSIDHLEQQFDIKDSEG